MKNKKGLAFIELLLVIALVWILAAIAIPMLKSKAMEGRIIMATPGEKENPSETRTPNH